MKKILSGLFASIFLFILSSFLRIEPVSASVLTYSGVLRDGTQSPIQNAEVSLLQSGNGNPTVTHTDYNGAFSLIVDTGTYSIQVRTDNFNIRTPSDITVNSDTVQDLTIPTVDLAVTILDPLANPVSNTLVSFIGSALPFTIFPGESVSIISNNSVSGSTDTSGQVHLNVLPVSNSIIYFYPPHESNLATESTNLSFSSATSLTYSLHNTLVYSGVLRDGTGSPVPGTYVGLIDSIGVPNGIQTNVNGEFSFRVPAGTYKMSILSGSYNITTPLNITVSTDTVQNVTIPTISLTVTVLDAAGQPLANTVLLHLSGYSGPISIFPGETSETYSSTLYGTTDSEGTRWRGRCGNFPP